MSVFSIKRRIILSLGAVSALGAGAISLTRSNKKDPHSNTLRAIVDTIVPADKFNGALDLGLDQRLEGWVIQNQEWITPISDLTTSISELSIKHHKTNFAALSLDVREQLLTDVMANTDNKLARSHLIQLRSLIMRWYYQTQTGRESLGYLLPSDYTNY